MTGERRQDSNAPRFDPSALEPYVVKDPGGLRAQSGAHAGGTRQGRLRMGGAARARREGRHRLRAGQRHGQDLRQGLRILALRSAPGNRRADASPDELFRHLVELDQPFHRRPDERRSAERSRRTSALPTRTGKSTRSSTSCARPISSPPPGPTNWSRTRRGSTSTRARRPPSTRSRSRARCRRPTSCSPTRRSIAKRSRQTARTSSGACGCSPRTSPRAAASSSCASPTLEVQGRREPGGYARQGDRPERTLPDHPVRADHGKGAEAPAPHLSAMDQQVLRPRSQSAEILRALGGRRGPHGLRHLLGEPGRAPRRQGLGGLYRRGHRVRASTRSRRRPESARSMPSAIASAARFWPPRSR